MSIDLTPLHKAIARLEFALERQSRDMADEEVRDSVIQRFEFTYDLSHKLLRRVLQSVAANPDEIARMSFPTLIRTGWEQGFLRGGWPVWSEFRDMRNITSHTYDIDKAIAVAAKVPGFLVEAKLLALKLAECVAE